MGHASTAPAGGWTWTLRPPRPCPTTLLTPVVSGFVFGGPWGLDPGGHKVITYDVDFFWWPPGYSAAHTTVEVFGPGGTEVWQLQDLIAYTLRYDGPALADETLYDWRVRVFDIDGNFSQAVETFRYVVPPPP